MCSTPEGLFFNAKKSKKQVSEKQLLQLKLFAVDGVSVMVTNNGH